MKEHKRSLTFRSEIPYPLLSCICTTSKLAIKAAKRDSDCFPKPPTPTSKALPLGLSRMRLILKIKLYQLII